MESEEAEEVIVLPGSTAADVTRRRWARSLARRYDQRGMRVRYYLGMVGWFLMLALAFGQTSPQASTPQSTSAQPTASQPASPQSSAQPATPEPVKPSAVDAAARTAKQARESAPPIKVIRNRDLNDGSNPPDVGKPAPTPQDTAEQAARDKEADEEDQPDAGEFEAHGKTFQNQVKVQKAKITDIQNRIASIENQFAAWSIGFAQDDEARRAGLPLITRLITKTGATEAGI